MKRLVLVTLLVVALLAGHIFYWYVPRERAVAPRLPVRSERTARLPAAPEPLALLAAGDYDVCLWVPYPHQNLGALAAAIGDLGDVVGAAARLTAGNGGEAAAPRSQEPDEEPTFGPFEVPPANELAACSDLAATRPRRLRVVARIYPGLAVVAKLAGRLAGNPWLAGGQAGPMRIAWSGRLWSVTSGPEMPPRPPAATGRPAPELPESLAVIHWTGARPEVPAGYYAMTRSGSDLAVYLVGPGGGAAGAAGSAPPAMAGIPAMAGPVPSLLVAVGPEWRGAEPFGGGVPAAPAPVAGQLLPPAALALFESGGSRLSSLGDLPGLAVFNAGPSGSARWRLPSEGIFRLLAGRLPAADAAGWKILALDPGSLRQAEALAPRLAALVPPAPAGGISEVAGGTSPAGLPPRVTSASRSGGAAGEGALSLGVWLEPRSALRIVSRIRQFVEKFPLATRRQVQLWRDWETVLDPLANCDHAALTATASPAALRLVLQNCTAAVPH
ncbi:MAG TPA: hypothetical protein VMW75_07060 [Thermoanaerobaculia bacterium]|nr:hypothetical protein [Thermoanaerobaculia bacterium]